ncbi:ABC transporter permease [Corynebacterium gerontici]|uniref:Glutathione transport system permease protein GsiD n=1 Tax=Corynebacterium gerontici TaxID=2079234 RepID=A0A3G6J1S2_9CORY|nr:ABC transporter permease [Corynebacterium gerontici]AZA11909.1 Glutathione transport system permease protein GsiD [Corynebacterium gerontici]
MKKLSLTGKLGLVVIASVLLLAALSFVWTPYDPLHAIPNERLESSSAHHLFGTDKYGRDVLSQIMVGARISLAVGLVAVFIAAAIGVPLGIIAGARRGIWDIIIMRISDVLLAFPALLMAIVATATIGSSTLTAMSAIGIAYVPTFARMARASTMKVMAEDFILAARDAERTETYIVFKHVLPNIIGLVVVQGSVVFGLAILAEAGLSFLGLGTPPPDPSWGRMLQAAQTSLSTAPWLAIWPGAAIALTVLGFNLFGDSLRDQIDPRHEVDVRP